MTKKNPLLDNSWKNITYQYDYFDCVYENLNLYDDYKKRVISNDGTILTNSEDSETYNFFDYYRDYFQGYYFDELKTPHLVVACVGTIHAFDHIIYSDDIIKILNEVGLEIYLWDNLMMSDSVDKKIISIDGHCASLPEEIKAGPEDMVWNLDRNNVSEFLYSFELESIKKFVKKHNLKKVTVYTDEYETSEVFQSKYPEFKIRGANTFVITYRSIIAASAEDLENLKFNLAVDNIKEKFLSLTLRYEPHRHLITSYLIEKSSVISWANNGREWKKLKVPTLEHLHEECSFDFKSWENRYPEVYNTIFSGNQLLQQKTPIRLESERHLDDIECGCMVPFPYSSHATAFCQLVTESTYGTPFPSFSEKAINAVNCLRPFIMVGAVNTLKYFKMLGFKTFDRWWDESYDQEEDHEKRILKIFEVIDYIDSFDIRELQSIYVEMKEILEHNFNQVNEIKKRPLIA